MFYLEELQSRYTLGLVPLVVQTLTHYSHYTPTNNKVCEGACVHV